MSLTFSRIVPLSLLAIGLVASLCESANAFGPCCCFCQEGRCQVKVEKEEVETTEFTCECETICIPPIRFPWECGPLKRCGKVRTVKVLGTTKGKESVCVYDWSAIQCCPSCAVKVRCGCRCGTPACSPCSTEPVMSQTHCAGNESPADESAFDAEEAAAFAARYPVVSVAMIDAIRMTKPDKDGWVTLSNHTSQSLAAESQLIETTVQD